MKKSELRASKDSQGFYEVSKGCKIVWEGFAVNANEAKDLAIEFNDADSSEDGKRWDDANCEWV